jgi:hypothetical protein
LEQVRELAQELALERAWELVRALALELEQVKELAQELVSDEVVMARREAWWVTAGFGQHSSAVGNPAGRSKRMNLGFG